MKKCVVAEWTYCPLPDDEEPCFLYYKISGTIDGKPFSCKVGFETDGRDADYEHITGENMDFNNPDQENWDALISSIPPEMETDMASRTPE